MHYVKLDIPANQLATMTDNELRNATRDLSNGEYTTCICRKCGMYFSSTEGKLADAEIVNQCNHCFDNS